MGLLDMQYACVVLSVLICCGLAQYQYGSIYCTKNDNGILTANMYIFRNGSSVTQVYFFNTANPQVKFNQPQCQWTGTGSATDPWRATVTLNTNNDLPDICGRTVLKTGDTYSWMALSLQTDPYYRENDRLFNFSCNSLPTNISVVFGIQLPDLITLPTKPGTLTLRPINNLQDTDTVTSINVGENFYLELRYQPDDLTQYSLKPWGAYCERLYATPDSNFVQRQTNMLLDTGCPRSDIDFLVPMQGFSATKPNLGDLYFAYTGAIIAARFDKVPSSTVGSYPTVYIVCEAQLCFKEQDQKCIRQCPTTTRRKRSEEELVKVVAVLTVRDQTEEASTFGFIPIVAGTAGGIALLAIVIAVACCCCRKKSTEKYDRHQDSVSNTSSVTYAEKRYGPMILDPPDMYSNAYKY